MTASFDIHAAEAALMKEHAFSPAVCRFLDYGRDCLTGSPGEAPPLPEAADFGPLAETLDKARDAFDSDLTLGLDADDAGIIAPLLAAFNLGNYACEAAERLIAPRDHAQDLAMEAIFDLSDGLDDLPFGRLIPLNEFRRAQRDLVPERNRFLFPWLTKDVEFDSDSLERIIQAWDELWSRTAPREDAEALVPVLTAIQADTALMNHLKAEAGFHAAVMKAAGELSRRQHVERARRSAGEGPGAGEGILDRIVSWFRMPALSGAVALILMAGIYFSTQIGKDGRPLPVGVTAEMLVYQDGLTVRGGEAAKPDVRGPGGTPPEDGDAIQLRFTLEENAYVYLYHQQSVGERALLFSGSLKKGTHVFPSGDGRMRIVTPGENECLILVASHHELTEEELARSLEKSNATEDADLAVSYFKL